MKDRSITKKAKVTIEQDGNEFDWWFDVQTYGPSSLRISTDPRSNKLNFSIHYTIATIRKWLGRNGGMSIPCGDDSLIKTGSVEELIYSENTRAKEGGTYNKVDIGQDLEVGISLTNCEIEERKVKCSLNKTVE